MKKEYELKGMSCGGCLNTVKNALLQNHDIEEIELHLNPQKVVLTMDKAIDVSELQAQLSKAGRYTINEKNVVIF